MEPSGRHLFSNSNLLHFLTCFRFASHKFKESHIKTIGIDYISAEYKHPLNPSDPTTYDKVDVKIWDTAG